MRTHSYRPEEFNGDYWGYVDRGEWEPETRIILERFLRPGDLFADIGAWIGPVTLWAVELGAHVIAWEPDADARKCLLQNTEGMDVRVEPEAWASTMGQAFLNPEQYFGDSSSKLGTFQPNSRKVHKITPEMAFLNDFRLEKPALIKVDIEGGETDILPSLMPLCAEYAVPVYLSWHEPWWPHPIDDETRQQWFRDFDTEPITGNGWNGFCEMLASPR